jgi:hypothetical protein
MKKIILTITAVFALTFVNAQDIKSSKGENYLPEAGDWAIGFNANGIFSYVGNTFNGNTSNAAPSVTYQNAGTFVGKKFISATQAYRVVANFAVASNESTTNPVPTSGISGNTYKTTGFDLYAGLGKEWRKGKTRLQGFYGADAYLGFSSFKYTGVNTGGADQTYDPGTTFKLGVNGFIGAEYFIFAKMSIGAQYNYGLNISTSAASKTNTGGGDVEGNKTSSFGLGGVGVGSLNLTLHF